MLIRNAEIWRGGVADVRIADGRIAAIGRLESASGERVCDARGAALLPGLHDHHIHLFALAASLDSVRCGPPTVTSGVALTAALRADDGIGWLRGIGYHESVAGEIDRHWLDAAVPDRPVRVQHRGGRLWIVNSCGLDLLLRGAGAPPEGLERRDGVPTGRLYEADSWLRQRLGGDWPDLARASALLAGFGVTGITEMTPANDDAAVAHLARQQSCGALRQSVLVAGRATLSATGRNDLAILATKFHLHENWLPDFDDMRRGIAESHAAGRPVAIHCVTRTELVFALAAIRAVGALPGDRIEHASVASDEAIAEIAALALGVVSQPNFIAERGDVYRVDVAPDDRPLLYRAHSFMRRGIPFAGGTDAPFGDADPWVAIRAATDRRTRGGVVLGAEEALSPEHAVSLFLADGHDIRRQRGIAVGAPADCCLLDRPWRVARDRLAPDMVRTVLREGQAIHGAID